MAEATVPLRVVVAEDEPVARRGIEHLLNSEPGVQVVGSCANGREALEAIRRKRPDVALLDVAMPLMTGVDVARSLAADERPALVFVTAFDTFAIEAFRLYAVDYLLKPFDDDRFRVAIARVRERVSARDARPQRIDGLLEAFERRTLPDRLVLKEGGRIVVVPVADIDWLEAADNYVRVHVGGREHLVRETMRSMEQRLAGRDFARIHRGTIVNVARIASMEPLPHGEYRVRLTSGTELIASRSYREGVLGKVR